MRRLSIVFWLLTLTLVSGCLSFKIGREFPSPDPQMVVLGQSDKVYLRRVFGEPYQVGIDSGDQTWRWFFTRGGSGTERSKDLTVRFDASGVVKAYSFSSNFPEDMKQLK